MRTLAALTVANARSFLRDRSAVFWTLAFPVIFILLFGSIFSGGGGGFDVGFVDLDGTPASSQLRQTFAQVSILKLQDRGEDEALADMREGRLRAVIVVPAGFGDAVGSAGGTPAGLPPAPLAIRVYTDPSQSTASSTIQQVVGQVVASVNLRLSGRPPILSVETVSLETQDLTNTAFLVPGILGMALMQLGLFGAIPLVAQREKLILKRLSATPLRRWALVGSNVLVRLAIAIVQALLIMGIGAVAFGVAVVGSLALLALFVVVGATMFIAMGYLVASFAPTEESTNGVVSVVNFPLMFLSGTFFPIDLMPEPLRAVAQFLPLTYLNDSLRQVMVNGTAFVPLEIDLLVLGGWLVVSLAISFRFFRWE